MAIPIPEGTIIEYIIEGRLYGQQVMSVFHYSLQNPGGLPDAWAACEAFLTGAEGAGKIFEAYLLAVSSSMVEIKGRAQIIYPVRYSYRLSGLAPNVGGVVSPPQGSNVSVTITKRTERTGRTQRGNLHMPAVPVTFITDGEVNGVGEGAYDTLREKILLNVLGAPGGGIWIPVIFHKVAPADSPIIEDTFLHYPTRVMRRRTVGLGS